MEWQIILALILVIPAALIWYINIGGIYLVIKEARERRAVREKKSGTVREVPPKGS